MRLVVISDRDAAYQYDLILIDLASGRSKALGATSVSRYNQQPVFTPDGRRILFLAGTEWNSGSRAIFSLWSIDLDGKNAKEIADSQLFTDPRKWSVQK
jgi:Tol biopolymer transport system component